ncbi:hypothetical protein LAZ67_X002941 [Cordylochernes scorpioides]|uniref:Uncharacterized protein n=1 Tax=Cordylochernes scorpioides TaxID=51811 RepID=A0ABY6LTR1_9ARAC|nr:hypothetical protein LAZ67_X002941 [Cordylochernes scorpioides]
MKLTDQPQKKQTEIVHANKLKHFHPSDNFKITHHMQNSSTINQINENVDLITFDSGEHSISDCVSILDQDNPYYNSSNLSECRLGQIARQSSMFANSNTIDID